jgi:hypothetical protein
VKKSEFELGVKLHFLRCDKGNEVAQGTDLIPRRCLESTGGLSYHFLSYVKAVETFILFRKQNVSAFAYTYMEVYTEREMNFRVV